MAKKIRGHGEGTIHQRTSGSWRAQISKGGKRFGKTFKKKADAHDWLRKTQNKLEMGQNIEGGKLTLAQYLPVWLENSEASLRSTTVEQYHQIYRDHILPHIGKIQLKDLQLAQIERLYTGLLGSGVSVRTVRMVHSVLHKALEKSVAYGHLGRNPAYGASLPRYTHSEMKVLDADQAHQFLVAAQDSRYEALYSLAIHTGMRQGELFGLKWADLNWNKGELRIQRQVKREPGQGWTFANPKTKKGRRTIKLGVEILKLLKAHKKNQDVQKSILGSRWKENGLILPSLVGTPLNPSNLTKDFRRVLNRAGLARIRFHDLRHTAASLMLNNGIPLIVVSNTLGHSKPSTTLDIYGHLYQETQTNVAQVMDELVTPIKVDMRELETQDVSMGESDPLTAE
jgi:integrase